MESWSEVSNIDIWRQLGKLDALVTPAAKYGQTSASMCMTTRMEVAPRRGGQAILDA